MKKVLGILAVMALMTSCGKNEIIQSGMKEVTDGVKVVAKGAFDVIDTGAKAVNDSHNESKRFLTNAKRVTDKGLTDTKNFIDESLTESKQSLDKNAHDLIEDVGKEVEKIGQIPRDLANGLLGTDADSNEDLADLENRVDSLYDALNTLSNQVNDNSVDQDNLSNIIASHTAYILKVENNLSVAEVIDPCGDYSNHFDEVLLVMSDGSIVAYFESRGKRFLTILQNGSYRTTDKQSCRFKVVNGKYKGIK
jgi:hypothetical protein